MVETGIQETGVESIKIWSRSAVDAVIDGNGTADQARRVKGPGRVGLLIKDKVL